MVDDKGANVDAKIYADTRTYVKNVDLVQTQTTLVEDSNRTNEEQIETNRLLLLILKQLELITGEENYG